jgi:hypothetical protein
LSGATTKPRFCQVRINAESPCTRRAVVEILGVDFCGPCARQQEIYFAIGELTQEDTEGLRGGALAEALKTMRRERASTKETMAAELPHRLEGARDPVPIAPTNS